MVNFLHLSLLFPHTCWRQIVTPIIWSRLALSQSGQLSVYTDAQDDHVAEVSEHLVGLRWTLATTRNQWSDIVCRANGRLQTRTHSMMLSIKPVCLPRQPWAQGIRAWDDIHWRWITGLESSARYCDIVNNSHVLSSIVESFYLSCNNLRRA